MDRQQIIDTLTQDILVRDGKSFVLKKDRSGGWDEGMEGGFSRSIAEFRTGKEAIRHAVSCASNMLLGMSLGRSFSLHLSESENCTNGADIWLSSEVFDQKWMSPNDRMDVFLGLAIHEGSHILYTDFSLGKGDNRLVKHLDNLFEDERIERLTCEARPGLANFLGQTKTYMFGKYAEKMRKAQSKDNGKEKDGIVGAEVREQIKDDLQEILSCIFSMVRFPSNLEEDLLVKHHEVLLEFRKVILPYPDSPKKVHAAAGKTYDLLRGHVKDEVERQVRKDAQEKAEAEAGEEARSEEDIRTEVESKVRDIMGELDAEAEKILDEIMEKIGDALGEICARPKITIGNTDKPSEVKPERSKELKTAADILYCEGKSEGSGQPDTYFYRACEAPQQSSADYNTLALEVSKYVSPVEKALKKHFRDIRFNQYGMRSGRLDTNKLAEARMGVETVYTRAGSIRTDNIAVAILVDQSGSMWGSNIAAARKAAVLLQEAVKRIPQIELYIYGHTADMISGYDTAIYTYREGGNRVSSDVAKIEAMSNNRDGYAIRAVAERVRRKTKLPVLYFIISDGAPAASGYGNGVADTKKAVEQAEAAGFSPVQIAIEPHCRPETMFRNYVKFTDMQTLATDLGRKVSEALVSNTRIRTR